GGQLLGAALRATLLHRRARRARLRDGRGTRQGKLRRADRGGVRARSSKRRRPLVPGRAAAPRARRQAAAAEPQGARARAVADSAGPDRSSARELTPGTGRVPRGSTRNVLKEAALPKHEYTLAEVRAIYDLPIPD